MNQFEEIKKWLKDTEEEPLEEMSGFFAKRVDSYEEHMSPWTAYYEWLGELIPKNANRLLDIGCGTGLELDRIFAYRPDIAVTGIDLSQTMLDKLQSKHGDKNLTLICGDYFNEPLGENIFDVAIAFETLHHFEMEKKLQIFQKIYKSLKRGGAFLEGDYIAESDEMERYLFDELKRRKKKWKIPDGVFVHFDTPLTLPHELTLLQRAGFKTEILGCRGKENTPMIKAVK